MATRIQVRRDTAANWAAAPTTLLAPGEIGFESDTLQFKIGDGVAQWQSLEYAGGTTPIKQNASGTTITDLNDASLRNNGNAKYLILGADTVGNDPSGLTTATDGQLLVTVAKYDYLGTSSANERYLMTLHALTTGKFFYRTYDGSGWNAWKLLVTSDPSGNAIVFGDLAVNGGDITTTSTGTATVFNTNATTLNVGQAATTVSIGATTGTATIRNATTAIDGAATVGGTLAVTGNTTLTGDLAVNGGDITTTSTGTATVFNTNATSLCLGEAAPTVSIGASTGTTTVNNDLAVNGGDITTSATGTATVFNTNATTLNVGGAATAVSIGATTGTATIRNATTAITGNATVGGSATVGNFTTSNVMPKAQNTSSTSVGFYTEINSVSTVLTLPSSPVGGKWMWFAFKTGGTVNSGQAGINTSGTIVWDFDAGTAYGFALLISLS